MNVVKFSDLVQDRIKSCIETMRYKRNEYAEEQDVLRNFRDAGRVAGVPAEKALFGMWLKHLISLMDMIDGKTEYDLAMINEKFIDNHNYLYLLEALLRERL